MRKLSLKAETVMPLDGVAASETEVVVGGTLNTPPCNYTPYTPRLPYTPQQIDQWRRRIQTGWCPAPPPPSMPMQAGCQTGMSVCRSC